MLKFQGSENVIVCLECHTRLSNAKDFQIQCLAAAKKRKQPDSNCLELISLKHQSSEPAIETTEEWVEDDKNNKADVFFEVLTDSVLPKTRKKGGGASTKDNKIISKKLKPAAILHKDVNFDPDTSCQFCFVQFSSTSAKQQHESFHTPEPQPYLCPICRSRFSQFKHLKQHYVSIHKASGRFSCGQCGLRFNYAARLRAHELKHANPKSFECQECGGKFSEEAALKSHQKNVHESEENEFICSDCGKIFKTKKAIKSHVKVHALSERKNECQICGKKFLSKEKLLRHSYYHTGNRPYVCNGCNKNYVSAYHLKRHKFYCKFSSEN